MKLKMTTQVYIANKMVPVLYEDFIKAVRGGEYSDYGDDNRYILALFEIEQRPTFIPDDGYRSRLKQVKEFLMTAFDVAMMKNLSAEDEVSMRALRNRLDAANDSKDILIICGEAFKVMLKYER